MRTFKKIAGLILIVLGSFGLSLFSLIFGQGHSVDQLIFVILVVSGVLITIGIFLGKFDYLRSLQNISFGLGLFFLSHTIIFFISQNLPPKFNDINFSQLQPEEFNRMRLSFILSSILYFFISLILNKTSKLNRNIVSTEKEKDVIKKESVLNKELVKKNPNWQDIIGGINLKTILTSLINYKRIFLLICRERSKFCSNQIIPYSPSKLFSAITFLFIGVSISFIINLSIIIYHDLNMNKWYFLIRSVTFYTIYAFLIHASIKAAGGKGNFKITLTILSFVGGALTPLTSILQIPFQFYYPLDIKFYSLGWTYQFNYLKGLNANFFAYASIMGSSVLGLYSLILMVSWIKTAHRLSIRRLLLSFTLIYLPLNFLYSLFLEQYVSRLVLFISDFLKAL